MMTFLLTFLLALYHIDFSPDLWQPPVNRQYALVAELLNSPYQSPYRIYRAVPPIRQSPFVYPASSITAASAVVLDGMSGTQLWQRNPNLVLPIASLTKLTTALVFLDTQPDFSKEVTYEKSDDAESDGGTLLIRPGETLTVGDLFYSSLIGSANNATKAMVRSTGLSADEFVQRMNDKVNRLGLRQTTFHEVTGLDPTNTSTVLEYGKLASYAFRQPVIREALNRPEYVFSTINTRKPHRIRNTDKLLSDTELHLIGAKTGYLDEAGYTFGAEAEENGHYVVVVLFKCATAADRFSEAKVLTQWAYRNFIWLEASTKS